MRDCVIDWTFKNIYFLTFYPIFLSTTKLNFYFPDCYLRYLSSLHRKSKLASGLVVAIHGASVFGRCLMTLERDIATNNWRWKKNEGRFLTPVFGCFITPLLARCLTTLKRGLTFTIRPQKNRWSFVWFLSLSNLGSVLAVGFRTKERRFYWGRKVKNSQKETLQQIHKKHLTIRIIFIIQFVYNFFNFLGAPLVQSFEETRT